LRAVLAHELAHCQRGDLWLNWIQLLLVAVWWFHPVLWLVNRSVRDIREDCCDDLLLARGIISNDAYCDVLLRAASEVSPPLSLSAALGFGQSIHPLGRRLARITDWDLQRAEGVSTVGAMAVLIGAALLFPGARSFELPPEAATPSAVAATSGPTSQAQPQVDVLEPSKTSMENPPAVSPVRAVRTAALLTPQHGNFSAPVFHGVAGQGEPAGGGSNPTDPVLRDSKAQIVRGTGPDSWLGKSGEPRMSFGFAADYPLRMWSTRPVRSGSGFQGAVNQHRAIFVPPPGLGMVRIGGRAFWPAGVHVRLSALQTRLVTAHGSDLRYVGAPGRL
jgi:hypothetical protein